MAVNPDAQTNELTAAARGTLMEVVTQQQVALLGLQGALKDIGAQFAGALSQIQPDAAEARQMASQAPDRGQGRGV